MARVQQFEMPASGRAAPAATAVPPRGLLGKGAHAPEALKNPRWASLCPDGGILVCDTWSHRVLRFGAPGSQEAADPPVLLAGTPNTCGLAADQLSFPSCAVFDRDGALVVADTNNHRVQRFAPGELAGTTIAGSARGIHGSGLGDLNMPTGIAIDPRNGSLLVADRANARVLRFAAGSHAGDLGEVVAGPDLVERPWGIAIGADGAVCVSDERAAVVLKLEVSELHSAGVQSPAAHVPEPPAAAAGPAQRPTVNAMELD